MSAAQITVFRDFPIINGYVQLPPNYEADRNSFTIAQVLTAIPTARVVRLGRSQEFGTVIYGSDAKVERDTAAGFGVQKFVRIPLAAGQSIWDLVVA